jgi:hypothetical protein
MIKSITKENSPPAEELHFVQNSRDQLETMYQQVLEEVN